MRAFPDNRFVFCVKRPKCWLVTRPRLFWTKWFDSETQTFLRLNLFMLRPILFIREKIFQCQYRDFFCLFLNQYMKWRICETNPDKHQSKILRYQERDFSFDQIRWDGDFFRRSNISIPILKPFLFNCWLLITMDPLHLCSSHHRNQWFSEARLDACYRQRRATGRYSTTHD